VDRAKLVLSSNLGGRWTLSEIAIEVGVSPARHKLKRYFKWTDSPVGSLKLIAGDIGLIAIVWKNDDPAAGSPH
jgi:hypothetical protein